MNTVGAIDPERIKSMLAQLKSAAQKPDAGMNANAVNPGSALKQTQQAGKVDFADALKASLNQVNTSQLEAEKLGKNFVLGDDKVSLSDVMIAGQKANIAFQATVQVRNKLVSAYQDIMNMPV
ncbi:Flagellar hook-basal body complex protein FliE [Methylophilaceae bacterium]|nr:Flagellar hook-basal body complex protein FliE [Methylophilaceae bacterium]